MGASARAASGKLVAIERRRGGDDGAPRDQRKEESPIVRPEAVKEGQRGKEDDRPSSRQSLSRTPERCWRAR